MAKQNKQENNFNGGDWIGYLVLALAILAITIAVYTCLYGPSVDPPTNMKTSDPYWYSGK